MRDPRIILLAVVLSVIPMTSDARTLAGTRVFIVGDSLVGDGSGLAMELRKRFKEQGALVKTEWRVGARVSTIRKDEAFHQVTDFWKPDLLIVSLGMNSARSPVKVFEKEVRIFGNQLYNSQRCYWIGPPVLVDGTEYAVARMREVVEKHTFCQYFDTAGMVEFPLGSVSGFHVRRWMGRKWAVKVWEWMQHYGFTYEKESFAS